MEKFIVIDFETTGIYDAEVLQVSIINQDEDVLLSEYCKPERHMEWPEAEKVHGITPERVKNCKSFREFIPKIVEIMNGIDYIVAYNCGFEFDILTKNHFNVEKPWVDPMLMFAEVYGEWNDWFQSYKWQKLTTAASYYGYNFSAHDALEDVKATLFIYLKMLDEGIDKIYGVRFA